MDAYNEQIDSVKDGSTEALDAIVVLARRLHFLHPFQDGNARMVSLILDRELALHGFNPVSMYNNLPHFVVMNTVSAYRTAITEVCTHTCQIMGSPHAPAARKQGLIYLVYWCAAGHGSMEAVS